MRDSLVSSLRLSELACNLQEVAMVVVQVLPTTGSTYLSVLPQSACPWAAAGVGAFIQLFSFRALPSYCCYRSATLPVPLPTLIGWRL